ncbi:hypothetical protein BJX68DRAFT_262130 [Aspergillus pseudodeflectus]|uniref:Uncharacterized protein n=1 Tax=Aspergillus pseudodeflectus TaxID=176178 RepID=A0ABR4L6E6_9EURO
MPRIPSEKPTTTTTPDPKDTPTTSDIAPNPVSNTNIPCPSFDLNTVTPATRKAWAYLVAYRARKAAEPQKPPPPYKPLKHYHFAKSFACTNEQCMAVIDNLTWGLFTYDAAWGIYDPRRAPPFFNKLSPGEMEALPRLDRLLTEVVMGPEDEAGYVNAIMGYLGLVPREVDREEDGEGKESEEGDSKGGGDEKKGKKVVTKAADVDWTVKPPEEIAFAQYRVDYHAYLHYLLVRKGVRWFELGDYMDTQRWKWCLERGRGQNWGDLRGRYVWERRGGI